jgi:hypothetical protein
MSKARDLAAMGGKASANATQVSFSESLHVTGDIWATLDVTAYYSDERLKEQTGPIIDALGKIDKIDVFKYNGNELAGSFGFDTTIDHVGVSAQSVQAVLPEVVKPAPFDVLHHKDGTISSASGKNYLTVQYEKLVPLLIAGIKELEARVHELENKVRVLKN